MFVLGALLIIPTAFFCICIGFLICYRKNLDLRTVCALLWPWFILFSLFKSSFSDNNSELWSLLCMVSLFVAPLIMKEDKDKLTK